MQKNSTIKYKIIAEYDRYYLCESPKGWKETFLKSSYKPVDGYIEKKDTCYEERESNKPDVINHSFNPSKLFREKVKNDRTN